MKINPTAQNVTVMLCERERTTLPLPSPYDTAPRNKEAIFGKVIAIGPKPNNFITVFEVGDKVMLDPHAGCDARTIDLPEGRVAIVSFHSILATIKE